MTRYSKLKFAVAAIVFSMSTVPAAPAMADPPLIGRLFTPLKRVGVEPESSADPAIELLAKNVDWLEHEVERWGSVAPKTPDVWGEARLTKYRREVETELKKEIDGFNKDQINAAQSISDSAFLAMAMAMNARSPQAISGGPTATTNIAIADQTGMTAGTDAAGNTSANTTLNPSGVPPLLDAKPNATTLQLEQVEQLDQLKRYLDHLNELRRINEGDDAADAPGYSLNLVRIPVSILPGTRSREGYGAEITFTATPVMDPGLLPRTYRELVINDLVDQISIPLTTFLNHEPKNVARDLNFFKREDFPAALTRINEALQDVRIGQATRQKLLFESTDARFQLYDVNRGQFTEHINFRLVEQLSTELGFLIAAIDNLKDELSAETKLAADAQPALSELKSELTKMVNTSSDTKSTDFQPFQITAGTREGLQVCSPQPSRGKFSQQLNQLQRSVDILDERGLYSRLKPHEFSAIAPDQNGTVASVSEMLALVELLLSTDQVNRETLKELTPAKNEIEGLRKQLISIDTNIDQLGTRFNDFISLPTSNTRKSTLPFPPRHLPDNVALLDLAHIALAAHQAFSRDLLNRQVVHLTDVQAYLREELSSAYELLSQPQLAELWTLDQATSPTLSEAIRLRNPAAIAHHHNQFLSYLQPYTHDHTAKALAWFIYVESLLLNERLLKEVQETLGESACPTGLPVAFYGPNPDPYARDLFIQFVGARWPLRIFTVDPVNTEQNIHDQSSIFRQMQLAVAMSFASGRTGASAAMQTLRRLQRDSATIDLNRTTVGFAHGDNTFGWRFYPRFQTPPVEGNATTFFRDLIVGGPTDKQLLRSRELEPGMRECIAIVIMPSFLSDVTIDSHSRWFRLVKPGKSALSNSETVQLSRAITSMRQHADACVRCEHLYRPGEVQRLLRRVEQLDRKLPLQTLNCKLPGGITLGGFEVLSAGTRELAPELLGWYGSPGYLRSQGSSFFLAGDNFSVHETRLVAGNQLIDMKNTTLLSRQVIEVTLPANLPVIEDSQLTWGEYDDYVGYIDLHLATPYGVSGHLMIPVLGEEKATAAPSAKPELSAGNFEIVASVSDGTVASLAPKSLQLCSIQLPTTAGLPAKPHSVHLYFATEHGPLVSQEFTNLAMTSGGLVTVQGKAVLDLFAEKAAFAGALKQYVDWRSSSSGISGDTFKLGATATVQYGGGGAAIAATGKMNCQVTVVKPEDDSE